jgi:hypothetical protein
MYAISEGDITLFRPRGRLKEAAKTAPAAVTAPRSRAPLPFVKR